MAAASAACTYEFDAPQFYDFGRPSLGGAEVELWFDARGDTPDRAPLAQLAQQNAQQPQQQLVKLAAPVHPAAANNKQQQQTEPNVLSTAKKSNIVTTWGEQTTTAKRSTARPAAPSVPNSAANTNKKQLATNLKALNEAAAVPAAGKAPGTAAPLEEEAPAADAPPPTTARKKRPSPTGPPAATPPDSKRVAALRAVAGGEAAASPRLTRSVSKKRLEEAALQHATIKAHKVPKSTPAPTPSAAATAQPTKAQQMVQRKAPKPANTATKAGASTAPASSTAAAASGGSKGPLRGLRLVGAVAKPSSRLRALAQAKVAVARSATSASGGGSKATGKRAASAGKDARRKVATTATAAAAAKASSRGANPQQQVDKQQEQGAAGSKAPRQQQQLRVGGVSKVVPVAVRGKGGVTRARVARASKNDQGEHEDGDNEMEEGDREEKLPAKSPFKALALKVKEFETKTPSRFKSRPSPPHTARKPLGITHPKSPALRTAARTRPTNFKPREVEEQEQMAALPAFHALPLRPDLLHTGPHVPPKPDVRPPTETQPFHFVTDDRAARRARLQEEDEHHHHDAAHAHTGHGGNAAGGGGGGGVGAGSSHQHFKAHDVDHTILEAPAARKKARMSMSLTVPASPLLATKQRAAQHEAQAVKWDERGRPSEFKARPMPKFIAIPSDLLQAPQHPEPTPLTQPLPFSLQTDKRGQAHQQKLLARLQEEEVASAAARKPKAHQPPGTTHAPSVPHRPEARPLTVPDPFNLLSEVRHQGYTAGFSEQLAQEQAEAEAQATFKARPMWKGVPYRLHPSEAPLTAPEEVHLATELRAADRSEFDRAVQDKIKAQEAERAVAAAAAARAEEEATKEYRRSLRFRAQPMPDLTKTFAVQPSTKSLTLPKTPKFGRKRKDRDE